MQITESISPYYSQYIRLICFQMTQRSNSSIIVLTRLSFSFHPFSNSNTVPTHDGDQVTGQCFCLNGTALKMCSTWNHHLIFLSISTNLCEFWCMYRFVIHGLYFHSTVKCMLPKNRKSEIRGTLWIGRTAREIRAMMRKC